MSDTLFDHSSRRKVTGPIGIGWVDGKESHIVSFSTDHKGKLGLVVGSTNGSSGLSKSFEFLPIHQLDGRRKRTCKLTRRHERIDLRKHHLGT